MITEKQESLMKHCIGDRGRNFFHTDKGCNDANLFDKLVIMGYATEEPAPEWMGGGVIYRLTDTGKNFIRRP